MRCEKGRNKFLLHVYTGSGMIVDRFYIQSVLLFPYLTQAWHHDLAITPIILFPLLFSCPFFGLVCGTHADIRGFLPCAAVPVVCCVVCLVVWCLVVVTTGGSLVYQSTSSFFLRARSESVGACSAQTDSGTRLCDKHALKEAFGGFVACRSLSAYPFAVLCVMACWL